MNSQQHLSAASSPDAEPPRFTAFAGNKRLASGPLTEVALAAKSAIDRGAQHPVLIYNDSTGRAIDIDSRGSDTDVLARLAAPSPTPVPASRGRGRPKLGVVSREVTLLPRHWQWLGSQPGGASVAMRKLVEAARRTHQVEDRLRARRDAAYHFMSAMAGDLPHFEEAARALFADDRARLEALIAGWPKDVREHACELAFVI